jgi:hypothetical protein
MRYLRHSLQLQSKPDIRIDANNPRSDEYMAELVLRPSLTAGLPPAISSLESCQTFLPQKYRKKSPTSFFEVRPSLTCLIVSPGQDAGVQQIGDV